MYIHIIRQYFTILYHIYIYNKCYLSIYIISYYITFLFRCIGPVPILPPFFPMAFRQSSQGFAHLPRLLPLKRLCSAAKDVAGVLARSYAETRKLWSAYAIWIRKTWEDVGKMWGNGEFTKQNLDYAFQWGKHRNTNQNLLKTSWNGRLTHFLIRKTVKKVWPTMELAGKNQEFIGDFAPQKCWSIAYMCFSVVPHRYGDLAGYHQP